MPVFSTTDDIRKSLQSAGLLSHADEIIQSARPCLVFSRRLAQDGAKNMMESRLGGFPVVPAGFEWPHQPAFRNAKKRAKQNDEDLASALQPDDDPWDDDFYAELAKTMSPKEVAKFKVDMEEILAAQKPPSAEMLAQMKASHEAENAALFKEFPMGFLGQINLGKLSTLDGFDKALPPTGMLSIFRDIRTVDGSVKVFHFSGEDVALAQMMPPTELVDYFNALLQGGETSWDYRRKCEVLEAQKAISVPYHWSMPQYGDDLYEWLHEAEFQFLPGDQNKRRETNFGDQLGGYPEVVQDLPEFDLMPKHKPAKVKPGQLPWFMIFSYSNEHFGDTRQMVSNGDGQSYLMMHIDDLADRKFDRLQEVYQQT